MEKFLMFPVKFLIDKSFYIKINNFVWKKKKTEGLFKNVKTQFIYILSIFTVCKMDQT